MGFHTLSFPPQSGVVRRTFHLLQEISNRHEVTILSFGSATDEAGIRQYFRDKPIEINFVRYDSPKWINLLKRIKMILLRRSLLQISVSRTMQLAFDEVFSRHDFDLVFLSSSTLLYYRMPDSIPCITDAHNVEYDLWYRSYRSAKNFLSRAYFYDQYRMMRRDEIELCMKPDALLTTSERDKAIFEKDLPRQTIHVIPNGVDTDYFVPQEAQEVPNSMVFSGVMNYLPNNQGIIHFLDKIFPLILKRKGDAKVFIVGAEPTKALRDRANGHIVVTGRVDDVRRYIAQAQVYVIPLLVGGGTRLKALEASAMKKAIVSTSVGCEGIDFRDGESALLADTPDAFCEAVLKLFDNSEYRIRLAEKAYLTVSKSYNWHVVGERLNQVFGSVAD